MFIVVEDKNNNKMTINDIILIILWKHHIHYSSEIPCVMKFSVSRFLQYQLFELICKTRYVKEMGTSPKLTLSFSS